MCFTGPITHSGQTECRWNTSQEWNTHTHYIHIMKQVFSLRKNAALFLTNDRRGRLTFEKASSSRFPVFVPIKWAREREQEPRLICLSQSQKYVFLSPRKPMETQRPKYDGGKCYLGLFIWSGLVISRHFLTDLAVFFCLRKVIKGQQLAFQREKSENIFFTAEK